MVEAKQRRRVRGRTRISRKNQITVPVEAMRKAGLKPGDELEFEVQCAGRVVVAKVEDWVTKYAGEATGLYPPGYLEKLRNEWR